MTKNNSKDLTVGSPTGLFLGFSLQICSRKCFQGEFYSLSGYIIVGCFLSVLGLSRSSAVNLGAFAFSLLASAEGARAGFSLPKAQRFSVPRMKKGLKKYVVIMQGLFCNYRKNLMHGTHCD